MVEITASAVGFRFGKGLRAAMHGALSGIE
jgi:hypothetical protein